MKGRPIINLKDDTYNISNINKNDYSGTRNKNNKNIYTINYNMNKTNDKISRNKEINSEIKALKNKNYLQTVNDKIINDKNNNKQDYNDLDDILNYGNLNSSTKNNGKKQDNKSKKNILKESGQNIVYGIDNNNNSKISNGKKINSNKSKLNNLTSSYERLEALNQLESENKKETKELLENVGENYDFQLEDI